MREQEKDRRTKRLLHLDGIRFPMLHRRPLRTSCRQLGWALTALKERSIDHHVGCSSTIPRLDSFQDASPFRFDGMVVVLVLRLCLFFELVYSLLKILERARLRPLRGSYVGSGHHFGGAGE